MGKSNKNYMVGYRAEREAMRILAKDGMQVLRTAGSHGIFDVVGFDKNVCRFIQIKVCQNGKANSFVTLRKFMEKIDLPKNCTSELWVYEKRVGWHFYMVRNY